MIYYFLSCFILVGSATLGLAQEKPKIVSVTPDPAFRGLMAQSNPMVLPEQQRIQAPLVPAPASPASPPATAAAIILPESLPTSSGVSRLRLKLLLPELAELDAALREVGGRLEVVPLGAPVEELIVPLNRRGRLQARQNGEFLEISPVRSTSNDDLRQERARLLEQLRWLKSQAAPASETTTIARP